MSRMQRPVHGVEEGLIFAAIGYEIAAKASQYLPGRTWPTWTRLNQQRPIVGKALLAGLAWHFRPLA